jgi:hypothetical protein
MNKKRYLFCIKVTKDIEKNLMKRTDNFEFTHDFNDSELANWQAFGVFSMNVDNNQFDNNENVINDNVDGIRIVSDHSDSSHNDNDNSGNINNNDNHNCVSPSNLISSVLMSNSDEFSKLSDGTRDHVYTRQTPSTKISIVRIKSRDMIENAYSNTSYNRNMTTAMKPHESISNNELFIDCAIIREIVAKKSKNNYNKSIFNVVPSEPTGVSLNQFHSLPSSLSSVEKELMSSYHVLNILDLDFTFQEKAGICLPTKEYYCKDTNYLYTITTIGKSSNDQNEIDDCHYKMSYGNISYVTPNSNVPLPILHQSPHAYRDKSTITNNVHDNITNNIKILNKNSTYNDADNIFVPFKRLHKKFNML